MVGLRDGLVSVLSLGLVLGLGFVSGCAAKSEAPAAPADDAQAKAASDNPASEEPAANDRQAALLAELEQQLEDEPENGAILYVLARVAARQSDLDQALDLLERLAALSQWDHPLDPDDFAPLADNERFTAVVAALRARAPAVTHGAVAMELDQIDLLPEGVSWDPKRGELLVGSMYRRQIFAADRQGHLREVIPAKAGGVLGVLGMDVDVERDQIWVAANGAPFIPGLDSDEATTAGIWGFDLETGEPVGSHKATREGAMLNDLVVLSDGAVVVTDSANSTLLVRRPGAAELEELFPPSSFRAPNGIAEADEPGILYMADFSGLHRIDINKRERLALAAPEGVATLGGIDGLDRQGDTLVGVQNVFTKGRIWAATLASDGRSITAARVLDDAHPRLEGATTGVFVGPGVFWYIANAGMQFSPKGLKSIDDDKRHVILEAKLDAEG